MTEMTAISVSAVVAELRVVADRKTVPQPANHFRFSSLRGVAEIGPFF
jgi:hypothetical protein